MLESIFVQIEFADPSIKAIDEIQDIRKAAEHAGLNLYSRHGIQLQYPMPDINNNVIAEVKIPSNKVDSFSIGYHLRGISTYLKKRCGNKYANHSIGNRLLIYKETNPPTENDKAFPVVDRLDAVSRFAKLLERNDEEANEYINQIITLLDEINPIR